MRSQYSDSSTLNISIGLSNTIKFLPNCKDQTCNRTPYEKIDPKVVTALKTQSQSKDKDKVQ